MAALVPAGLQPKGLQESHRISKEVSGSDWRQIMLNVCSVHKAQQLFHLYNGIHKMAGDAMKEFSTFWEGFS